VATQLLLGNTKVLNNVQLLREVQGTHDGHCESFNDKLRDELLNLEIFDSMWEVRTMLQDRRHSYNHYRPHSSLSYLTPVEFAEKWRGENALLTSHEVDR
jgi:putative transposase